MALKAVISRMQVLDWIFVAVFAVCIVAALASLSSKPPDRFEAGAR